MTSDHWILIAILAIAAFSIRVVGLLAGDKIRASRHAWMLDEIPGLIVVSLIAASLAGQPLTTWVAAAIALCVAHLSHHVIATMVVGVFAYASLSWLAL
ncbi:AzlD domain-containing protein [Roseobacter sp. YSTF-M11]|uniref:AzlD domain-containing protein n=1 Tax=Roseobacter insulae TaxID=2859783 RepID=A0A9X1FY50_9RHOB|nr:AzlD domain-containing protein [Roseobacter insulae]MBW4709721.1 AzlD domain-containing protein [Roseobacter insulae]